MYLDLAGAGGNWPVIDEISDPSVIQQQGDLSCGIACGQMLLKDRKINIESADIEALTGTPVSSQGLASALNLLESDQSRQWEGGPLKLPGPARTTRSETLNTTGSWSAMLWETSAGIGHLIIVDGLDDLGYVLIRDPWEGTKYKMTQDHFCQYWTTEAIFARKI